MTSSRRPLLRADLIARQIDEDFAVYDPITDRTSILNLAASVVLELCDGHHTLEEIASELCRLFTLDADTATRDVQGALETFHSHSWLDIK
jgi:hypothetical protein